MINFFQLITFGFDHILKRLIELSLGHREGSFRRFNAESIVQSQRLDHIRLNVFFK
jgi:hypothetical protein